MARHSAHLMMAALPLFLGLVLPAGAAFGQSPKVAMYTNNGGKSTIEGDVAECLKRAEASIKGISGFLVITLGNTVEGLNSAADRRVFVDCVAMSDKSTHARVLAVSADDKVAQQLFDDVNKAVIK